MMLRSNQSIYFILLKGFEIINCNKIKYLNLMNIKCNISTQKSVNRVYKFSTCQNQFFFEQKSIYMTSSFGPPK